MEEENTYKKYRGKCKEFVDAEIDKDPTLRAVRGWYHCPLWGKQNHWWCVREDGTILDPTVKQFPSGGLGIYEEYVGILICEQCGTTVREEEAHINGNYGFCSTACAMRFVGL